VSRAAPAGPHAPRPGWVTGAVWYRLHAFGVRVVPDRLVAPVLRPLAFAMTAALPGIADALGANLEAVLGPTGARERRRRGRRTLRQFAWCLTERYERLCTDRRFEVAVDGLEAWRRATAGGRGVVLLTAHVGVSEIGSLMPATEEARPVHLVREGESDPAAQRWFAALIERRLAGTGHRTHFAGADPGLGVALLGALRAGEVVALQGDRPRAGGRTVAATLFGRPYPLPEGPLALARAAAVPILPAFTLREGRRRYRVRIEAPIEVVSGADRAGELRAAASRVSAAVERAIRSAPHQWFCFAKIWP
jgi:lauroyl/myristoyl acyltransferase